MLFKIFIIVILLMPFLIWFILHNILQFTERQFGSTPSPVEDADSLCVIGNRDRNLTPIKDADSLCVIGNRKFQI